MKSIAPLWRFAQLLYFKRALAELSSKDPCHEDVNLIVLRINTLEAK